MSFSTTLTVEVSRAFFVDTPTVDLLNVGPSISPKVVEVLVVIALPWPDPVMISPVSASTNLTCSPNWVTCLIVTPLVSTTSSSPTEKS